ncbi:uncharacterized protein LOC123776425 [Ursus americanus]|uniref:uncharacterized protein LOC123776425 n=1 Tax=Ursus americanus TaxID=9643 RepID=UPI001E67C7C8|nr:uncharacterized protein LOC123776425 [Ursus americanus]
MESCTEQLSEENPRRKCRQCPQAGEKLTPCSLDSAKPSRDVPQGGWGPDCAKGTIPTPGPPPPPADEQIPHLLSHLSRLDVTRPRTPPPACPARLKPEHERACVCALDSVQNSDKCGTHLSSSRLRGHGAPSGGLSLSVASPTERSKLEGTIPWSPRTILQSCDNPENHWATAYHPMGNEEDTPSTRTGKALVSGWVPNLLNVPFSQDCGSQENTAVSPC